MEPLPSELAAALALGNVALWLGSGWTPPSSPEAWSRLCSVSWLAVWTENTSPAVAANLRAHWAGQAHLAARGVLDVSERLTQALGTHYSFSDICPVFFLRGQDATRPLLPRERRRARDEAVDQLARLRAATLLVEGVEDLDEVTALLTDELASRDGPKLIIFSGVSPTLRDRIADVVGTSLTAPHVCRITHHTIDELIAQLPARQSADARTIRVGTHSVPIAALLERERPIDQDYHVLTEWHTRAPGLDEAKEPLLRSLLCGDAPWRAFARAIQWPRQRTQEECARVLRELRTLQQHNESGVATLAIPGDAGAGLTTLFSEVAFVAASEGFPTLALRRGAREIGYETVRPFLESMASHGQTIPALIVVGRGDCLVDCAEAVTELVDALLRDARRAVVLHALPRQPRYRHKGHRLRVLGGSRLSANLDDAERASLCKWTATHWPAATDDRLTETIERWGADWHATQECPPLLNALYFLLHGDITTAADVGRHYLARVMRCAPQGPTSSTAVAPSTSQPLTRSELITALDLYRAGLRPAPSLTTPTAAELATLYLSLCILAALRIEVTRSLVSQATSIPRHVVDAALTQFASVDAVVLGLREPLARTAYYTSEETVGLGHPADGRIVLEWLSYNQTTTEAAFLGQSPLFSEMVGMLAIPLPDYPIGLLRIILERLHPSAEEIQFAEYIATRFLRFQRNRSSDYSKWAATEHQIENMRALLHTIPERVVVESPSILHSRAITSYKSCRETVPIGECRERYVRAAADLESAVLLIDRGIGNENAANVITSHGLMCRYWSKRERGDGDPSRVPGLASKAASLLEDGLRRRRNNPYAAFGLASALVDDCSDYPGGAPEKLAADLCRAVELLQQVPAAWFQEEWEELRLRAIQLLSDEEIQRATISLQLSGEGLGYVLAALKLLDGHIPIARMSTMDWHNGGMQALSAAEQAARARKPSPFAPLLHYALYSASPERGADPSFDGRYRLIRPLVNTRFMEEGIWLFDLAMLAFQTRHFEESARAFVSLRRHRAFVDVPLERASWFGADGSEKHAVALTMRVVNVEERGRGWARIDELREFREPVSFDVAGFRAAGRQVQPGATLRANLRLNPSGPRAFPVRGY